MNLNEAYQFHNGAITLDSTVSPRRRKQLRGLLLFSVAVATVYGTVAMIAALPYGQPSAGIAFMAGAGWVLLWLCELYRNTFYFFGLDMIIGGSEEVATGCTFEVAAIVAENPTDLTQAFTTAPLGREVLARLGVTRDAIDHFSNQAAEPVSAASIPIDEHKIITLEVFGASLAQRDPVFATFLREQGILAEQFTGALAWVAGRIRAQKAQQHWWNKDNLSQTTSLGREWSYGTAPHLEQYAKDIYASTVFTQMRPISSDYARATVEMVEAALARDVSANALLIGEAGVGKMDILLTVASRIATGQAIHAVAGHHFVVLDTNRLFTMHEQKADIEAALLGLLTEAEAAGNIVLIVERLSQVITESTALDIQFPDLLDRFLASPDIHIIATDTPEAYHAVLEPLRGLTRRFQEILIDPPNAATTASLLFAEAQKHEQPGDVFFTYQAITAITTAAERHIVHGVMPDKAIQLMSDVVIAAQQQQQNMITADIVYRIVSEKTGVPAGPIEATEKDRLLNLESTLHQSVIGQDRAVTAIANAMRRARVGIQSPDRPLGSFLFLGPTGVGKTETAKALATVFFGDAEQMNRLDMSEYGGGRAITQLLGTAESAGTLASLLSEHPYCVLLLDEFEKASPQVHDLFLQILDEGVFTDGRGQKINARNAIIIATSNAGSDLINKTLQQRQVMATLDAEIINHIIASGIFKPELINRFDSTIIFEPLQTHEQAAIAQLLLDALKVRIHDQGYTLTVTDTLLKALAEKGYSAEFGARPMRRLLQDIIEAKVAEKIIAGELKKGGTIALDVADFAAGELTVQTD